MGTIKRYWFPLVLILALVAVVVVQRQDFANRAEAGRQQLISGCVRTSPRAAVTGAWAFDAARVRTAAGDKEAGRRYSAYGNGLLMTLPAPAGHIGDPALAEVHQVELAGRPAFVLSASARAMERLGCEEAYPKP